ncbi:hypothetical protein B9Z55_025232 [Caenorhabditis nigoni]|uniref:Protein kinase domain-containing protein n=1 Tax=Caenorhabditis nigoni TaxID=1611254 RepID=A0A2G5SY55_9PELO|nr:hypothetical protein B9Z55_025232 [Caenorhabditis nigoni]
MDGRWFQTAPPNSREDEDKVFLAQSTTSNQNFAIKTSIRRSKDDKIPRSILKEVLMLHDMDHENVIPFEECFSTTNEEGHTIFHLVFQLCSFDLNRLLHIANVHLTIGNQRTLTLSLLAGLKYIHLKNIVHRDLKPHNILISESGRLKIADFGTATYYVSETPQTLSPTVGTPGYIAPELLLGSENYGAEIDIWSAGIIAAEIILGNEIIPGGTTRSQLRSIGRMFGGQPISKWERWGQFPLLNEYSREVTYPETGSIQNKLDQLPGTEKVNGARLIKKMLKLCPRKRVTASRAQNDAWFLTTPPPAETIPEVVRAVMAQRAVPRR